MKSEEILKLKTEAEFNQLVEGLDLDYVVRNQFEKAKKILSQNIGTNTYDLMKSISSQWIEKLIESDFDFSRTYGPIQGMTEVQADKILDIAKRAGNNTKASNPHFRRNLNVMAFDMMVNKIMNPESADSFSPKKDTFVLLNQNRTSFDSDWNSVKKRAKFHPKADKETNWDFQIAQSPSYEYFTNENIDRFKSFLRETDNKPHGRGAEFFCLITLTDGVPASQAGELVKFYSDEATGFWDDTATKKINTITDIANLSLLRKLPSPNSEAAQFGSTFEKLADVAFIDWYKKTEGVKLISLKNRYYSQMVNTASTGEYRQGTDQFFYDEVNEKYLTVDYKMPQVFSKTDLKFNKRDKRVKDDYIYQAALYKKAAQEVLPKGAVVESRVVQFGVKGLQSYLSPVLSDTTGTVMEELKQRVSEGIASGDPGIRLVSHTIEPAKGSVNELLLPALEYYNSFLEKGVAPVDSWQEKRKYSSKNQTKVKDLNHQVAMLQSLSEKLVARNDSIKLEMTKRAARVGDKIQNVLSTTTESRRMPAPDIIYSRAVEKGFDVPKGEFMKQTVNESVALDVNLVRNEMIKTGGNVGWEDVAKITRVYREKNRFDNKPAIELAADNVIEKLNKDMYQVTPKSDPQSPQHEYDGTGPSNQIV